MKHTDFAALGISSRFSHTLAAAGFCTPTDIQQQAIPLVLDGGDVLGIAQTGTGKTAAFGLPLLQLLAERQQPAQARHPLAVVLAPTRELATQIFTELSQFAEATDLRLACIFGGVGQHPQIKALKNGVDVLIATPGRLLDLMSQDAVKLTHVSFLVLDEADRLLDLGFAPDVNRIVGQMPRKRCSLLFSATMPAAVTKLANRILRHPTRVDVSPREVTVQKIEQHVVRVKQADKQKALATLLHRPEFSKVIVFTRTKHGADRVVKRLGRVGIEAAAIHGNKSQNARTRALGSFADGDVWVLVATDIAARGIDIEGVSHVVNFDVPHDPETYVHRIGRTGRAGAPGISWTLLDQEENKYWKGIERLIGFAPTLVELALPKVDESMRGPSAGADSSRRKQSRAPEQQQVGEQRGGGRSRRRPRRRRGRAKAVAAV